MFEGCVGSDCRAAEEAAPPSLATAAIDVSLKGDPATLVARATGIAPFSWRWEIDAGRSSVFAPQVKLGRGMHRVTPHVRDALGAQASVTRTIEIPAALQ